MKILIGILGSELILSKGVLFVLVWVDRRICRCAARVIPLTGFQPSLKELIQIVIMLFFEVKQGIKKLPTILYLMQKMRHDQVDLFFKRYKAVFGALDPTSTSSN